MKRNDSKYDDYADHPRYGKRPQKTGENPQDDFENGVNLHWHTQPNCLIPNTAIAADCNRQVDAMFPITHYFDVKRRCQNCKKMFIFFAREQQFWYESLQFSINADCNQCAECRKQNQFLANRRAQFELLLKAEDRSDADTLTLVDCCLTLIEIGKFGKRSIQTARQLLNSIPEGSTARQHARFNSLVTRSDKLLENEERQT